MKIGLYLQNMDDVPLRKVVFNKHMNQAKLADIDILVFPENCYTPFNKEISNECIVDEKNLNKAINCCMELSKRIRCAIIYGGKDISGAIYSIYCNAYANSTSNEETDFHLYIKHTATSFSAFDYDDYQEVYPDFFDPIYLKDKSIGMTICYDCNHSIFSRMWGKNGIDILINSTGGNVQYHKWHRYNKVRAIENKCFNFCTMGFNNGFNNSSYTFGFTPNGKLMKNTKIGKSKDSLTGIYVYDTDCNILESEVDIGISQKETENKYKHIFINPSDLFFSSKKLTDDIYINETGNFNIIYCILNNEEIFIPEKVSMLLYNDTLKEIQEKKYIIISRWDYLERDVYETKLSDVLRVRSMENYCAVLLISPDITKCYQCSDNKTSQVVKPEKDGTFGIDLNRTGGPETIWKNKPNRGIKAKWRSGYEMLIKSLID